MLAIRYYIIISLLAILALNTSANAASLESTRKQLFENQRNLILLRKEKDLFRKELDQALSLTTGINNADAQALIIADLQDSIAIADVLISNSSVLVARQRLLFATLERGTPPTALDIALNKALNSNLPELIKNLSTNEVARKEVSRLRALLKKQARLGTSIPNTGNSVSVAVDQQVAEDEFLRLLALFSGGTADSAEDKKIKITGTSNDEPFSETEILSYLGHNQYHMETTVYNGKMTFTIDGRPWQLNIPEIEDQATYVIIYDITTKVQPRMVMFNKSLLLE